ncbi:hypothetical protein HDU93_004397 [Gonapodya sp. JEL0774]|nr:hypothetical protein HDU93_004397 [Gonapodya sp. JEL0774]
MSFDTLGTHASTDVSNVVVVNVQNHTTLQAGSSGLLSYPGQFHPLLVKSAATSVPAPTAATADSDLGKSTLSHTSTTVGHYLVSGARGGLGWDVSHELTRLATYFPGVYLNEDYGCAITPEFVRSQLTRVLTLNHRSGMGCTWRDPILSLSARLLLGGKSDIMIGSRTGSGKTLVPLTVAAGLGFLALQTGSAKAKTVIVLTPYVLVGMQVVEWCRNLKWSYISITGEDDRSPATQQWMGMCHDHLQGPPRVVVINWSSIHRSDVLDTIRQCSRFIFCIVVDEAQEVKYAWGYRAEDISSVTKFRSTTGTEDVPMVLMSGSFRVNDLPYYARSFEMGDTAVQGGVSNRRVPRPLAVFYDHRTCIRHDVELSIHRVPCDLTGCNTKLERESEVQRVVIGEAVQLLLNRHRSERSRPDPGLSLILVPKISLCKIVREQLVSGAAETKRPLRLDEVAVMHSDIPERETRELLMRIERGEVLFLVGTTRVRTGFNFAGKPVRTIISVGGLDTLDGVTQLAGRGGRDGYGCRLVFVVDNGLESMSSWSYRAATTGVTGTSADPPPSSFEFGDEGPQMNNFLAADRSCLAQKLHRYLGGTEGPTCIDNGGIPIEDVLDRSTSSAGLGQHPALPQYTPVLCGNCKLTAGQVEMLDLPRALVEEDQVAALHSAMPVSSLTESEEPNLGDETVETIETIDTVFSQEEAHLSLSTSRGDDQPSLLGGGVRADRSVSEVAFSQHDHNSSCGGTSSQDTLNNTSSGSGIETLPVKVGSQPLGGAGDPIPLHAGLLSTHACPSLEDVDALPWPSLSFGVRPPHGRARARSLDQGSVSGTDHDGIQPQPKRPRFETA